MQLLGYSGRLAAMARASAGRLATVLSAPPLVQPGALPAPPAQPHPDRGPPTDRSPRGPLEEPRLALERVSYRRLRDVCLQVAPGEVLGVVSHDPRDADALLALLAGQAPRADHQGRITIGGVAAEALDLDARRRAVLVEPHDTQLFEGTLRDNLLAGRAAAGEADPHPDGDLAGRRDDRLWRALRAAAAEEIVTAHPDGLDQVIADRGRTLSGGQRQRIGLARALVADPPVLVLHEPTTAVDAVTEERIAHGLATLRGAGGTASTIVLTSSPVLLSRAHRVVVLADGRIRAEGRHTELARTDHDYQEAVLR